ncbi:MAG TPA: hypothetical protein VHS28_08005 [Chloroflexota bacterium]|nr:hypothetical protein [Chloroflexota bacterium]
MRRLLIALALTLAVAIPMVEGTEAQAGPQFQFGFSTLASLIPSIVGQPLENEHFDVTSGNSLQQTTNGLMVWRKADNVAAFTDGSTTWVIGPQGLQTRPNDTRFDWETAATPTSTQTVTNGVSLTFSRAADGGWVGRGNVQNTLGVPADVEVNVVGFDPSSGNPVIDAPTVYVLGLAQGGSAPIRVSVPTTADSVNWQTFVTSHPTSADANFTMDVGASQPLSVDPALAGAIAELRRVDNGDALVKSAADNGVVISESSLPASILGGFAPEEGEITIAAALEDSSAWVRATVLAHELQHAADAASGFVPQTTQQCLQEETNAFQRQSVVWNDFWRNRLPADVDRLHAELNDVTNTVNNNPQAFAALLARRYRSECGASRQ